MRNDHFLIILCITLLFSSGCIQDSINTDEFAIKIIGKESYDTIQQAINHASNGDTIIISEGTYYEHIQVNKSVVLIGENKEHTILDGNNTSTVCILNSNDVSITNVSIRNSGSDADDSGIHIQANNCVIENCTFYQNDNGISISIVKNTRNNIIFNNTFYHNHYGIYIKESNRNHIIHNNIVNNTEYGIFLDFYANTNQLSDNFIKTNGIGIRIKTAILNTLTNNWLIENTGEGIHLCCSSHDNTIYQNYLINNSVNAMDHYDNQWSYKQIGNYWSDYILKNPSAIDENEDGLWDTPYEISDGENSDKYPLTTYPLN